MPDVIALVLPSPNEDLVTGLRALLAEAECGKIDGMVGVKLRPDNAFAVFRIGGCSDLKLAGALAFAQHDLIQTNPRR